MSPILPSSLYFSIGIEFSLIILAFHLDSFFCFSGVRLTTKGQFTEGGGAKAGGESTTVGNRGVGKDEGGCGRVRGGRSLWALEGVTSHSHPLPSQPPLKKSSCYAPSATISQPSPQESTGPKVSDPAGQATGPASPAAPSASEEDIPAHMQPL